MLTSLGEESAESLIRLSGLALFGEVSIRLSRESISKMHQSYRGSAVRMYIPEYRAQGSRAII